MGLTVDEILVDYSEPRLRCAGLLITALGCIVLCLGMDHPAVSTAPTITVYERASQTLDQAAAMVADGVVFLPMDFLVDPLGLRRKDLLRGRVGICRKDLCVPFSVGAAPDSVRRVGEREFVPIGFLVKALGGTIVWDAEEKSLLLDLATRPAPRSATSEPHLNVTLMDLAGNPVPLCSFQGKKVLLFAWASW